MEAIPEVQEVAARLAAVDDHAAGLLPALDAVCDLAVAMLPSVVGVSITVVVDGDAFTVTATAPEMNVVDAAQYLDGGPCVDAAQSSTPVQVDDVLDEARWRLFGQAAAATGILSSLSIPLRRGDHPSVGALNLYASDVNAFVGKEGSLAALFGVRANELVTNADLGFHTRDEARQLPQRLADHEQLNQAVGALSEQRGWSAEHARERLVTAADRAGTSVASVASVVMSMVSD